jgi:2-polyprenyl-6-methoxyphenol hydroxylase-like FAD-dependent oxidoreductase
VERIPEKILIDYKLLWRDPTTKWVSDNGRMVLVGDAAHPHLATSGQGAAQAIEDGATLGAVLDRAGKSNIPLALKAFEKLR